MSKRIFQIILLNLILSCKLIAMQNEAAADGKIQKGKSSSVNPIPTEVSDIKGRAQIKDEPVESLMEKLKGIHISDEVGISTKATVAGVSAKVNFTDISEVSAQIKPIIKNLHIYSQLRTKNNLLERRELKETKIEDDWLSNEFVPELLLDYLRDIVPHLYNIMEPVDVHNNWWDLTRQILESINQQLSSGQVSPFTIVPINFGNFHWATMVIEKNFDNFSNPFVYFFDSLGSSKGKLAIIKDIVEDTKIFDNPKIVDLSSPGLVQKDGKTCGTWMLESIKAIIQGREKGFQDDHLLFFVHNQLRSINIDAQHAANLLRQAATDIWIGKAGDKITDFTAKVDKKAEKHPNYKGRLNKIIRNILLNYQGTERLSLNQLHQMAYQKLFELEEYKKFATTNYAFTYDINNKQTRSLNFLHLFSVTNESKLLSLVLEKCFPNLTKVVDTRGNTILHMAAYYGVPEMVGMIIKYAKKHRHLNSLMNARNHDGTNPLGMLFLNYEKISKEYQLPTANLFIMEPSFEINRYLNNKRGMDVFAEERLKRIGGYNCLHMACFHKDTKLLKLLEKRHKKFKGNDFDYFVNFFCPSLNPNNHNTSPNRLLGEDEDSDDTTEKLEELQGFQCNQEDWDDSGSSDDDTTLAYIYNEAICLLDTLIKKSNKLPEISLTKKEKQSLENLTREGKEFQELPLKKQKEAKDLHTKLIIPHFHGVPFMQGPYRNYQRREVAKQIFDINRKKIERVLSDPDKKENIEQELEEKDNIVGGLHSRTSTATTGIDTLYDLTQAEDRTLRELNQVDEVLGACLANHWNEDRESFQKAFETYLFDFAKNPIEEFWNKIRPPTKDIVKYRFPLLSTSKAPDHAIKFGIGKNVETRSLGELPLSPNYNRKGRPKHRLAGLLYISFHAIDDLDEMYDSRKIADATQLYLSQQVGHNGSNHRRIMKQIETTFFGGISGNKIIAVLPILYPNFEKKKNQEKFFKESSYEYRKPFDNTLENEVFGNGLPQCYQKNKSISGFGKILMPYYVKKALELAQSFAKLQGKHLCYNSPKGQLKIYPSGYAYDKCFSNAQIEISGEIPGPGSPQQRLEEEEAKSLRKKLKQPDTPSRLFSRAINDTKKNIIPPKFSGEESIIITTKSREFSYKTAVPRKLFNEEGQGQKNQDDNKDKLDKENSLLKLEKTEKKKVATSSLSLDNTTLPSLVSDITRPKKSTAILKSPVLEKIEPTILLSVLTPPDSAVLNQPTSFLAQGKNLEKLKLLAQQGDKENQYKLARIYREKAKEAEEAEDRQTENKNNTEAVKLYIEAAKQDHALAQYYLGYMYEMGLGITQSDAHAIQWYTKAASKGDETAKKRFQKLEGKL